MKFLSVRTIVMIALVVAVVGGGYFWFGTSRTDESAVVVSAGEFVQEVNVSGKVIAAHDVDLGFAGSGRVAGVYAQVGSWVEAGQVIAEIENGDLRAAVAQKEAARAAQEAKLAAIKAGTRPESVAVSQASVSSAESALAQADQALINAIADAYRASDDAVRNKVDLFLNAPRSVNTSILFPVNDQSVASALIADRIAAETMLTVWNKEVASIKSDTDLDVPLTHARGNIAATVTLLSDANAVLNHAITTTQYPQSSIDTYTTSIATARTNVNGALTALTTALSAQKAARSTLVSAQKSLALARAPATLEDIAEQEAQIRAAASDVDAAYAQLTKTRIVAPFSGVVTKMDAKTGFIASANNPLVSLQSRGTFQIESFVPETRISLIKVGQKAHVTLDAYGDRTTFDARVASIDPAETVHDGVSTYRIILQFVKSDERIKSGMSANVKVEVEKREHVVAIPVGLVYEQNGHSFVRVISGDTVSQREVTTGATSSSGNIEIVSGLSEGETITPPLK